MKRIPSSGGNFTLSIGSVKNNSDPMQLGRLQVFIPSVDSRDFEIDEDIGWAYYVSPFGGTTANIKVGRESDEVPGVTTYGMWAIPKNGAQVLVGYLEGNTNVRFWMGCLFQPELNRTLPHSIDGLKGEIDESGFYPQAENEWLKKNLEEAGLGPSGEAWKTRGGYERSVSYPQNKSRSKPTDNGYAPKPLEKETPDSQMFCFTTPGRHYMLFSDIDEYCRMRFRTTAGNQVIFDDTNERIYVSTAKGRNWLELDEGSGKINIYSSSKINIHSENDINLCSDENINIVAKKRVNIQSEERGIKIQAKMGLNFLSAEADVKITASRDIHLRTLDGAIAGAVAENATCMLPPYSGGPLGFTRDYAEEAGSSTSRVVVSAIQNVEIRSDTQAVQITASQNVDVRSMGADTTLHAANNVNFKGTAITTMAGPVGCLTVDPAHHDVGLRYLEIISKKDFGGSAQIAHDADIVTGDVIREKMVVPEHESRPDDPDEAECKTPRNSNYQG